MNYFFYGETVADYFATFVQRREQLQFLIRYHRFISFALYLTGECRKLKTCAALVSVFVVSFLKNNCFPASCIFNFFFLLMFEEIRCLQFHFSCEKININFAFTEKKKAAQTSRRSGESWANSSPEKLVWSSFDWWRTEAQYLSTRALFCHSVEVTCTGSCRAGLVLYCPSVLLALQQQDLAMYSKEILKNAWGLILSTRYSNACLMDRFSSPSKERLFKRLFSRKKRHKLAILWWTALWTCEYSTRCFQQCS